MAEVSSALGPAIRDALEAQRAYEARRQSVLGQGAERLTRPVGAAVARAVPSAFVRKGLEMADRAAGVALPYDATGHDVQDIVACETAALRVQKWAMGSNAASGGVAGWFGAAGMTADIPATIMLAAHNVRATGAAFGFAGDSEEERMFRLMILELATAQGEARRQSVAALRALSEAMNSPAGQMVLEKGGEWVTEKVVERVLRQVGASLGSRKAAQVVPVLGGAVAAVINASFQADVARAARYAFRQRWLIERRLLGAPDLGEDLG